MKHRIMAVFSIIALLGSAADLKANYHKKVHFPDSNSDGPMVGGQIDQRYSPELPEKPQSKRRGGLKRHRKNIGLDSALTRFTRSLQNLTSALQPRRFGMNTGLSSGIGSAWSGGSTFGQQTLSANVSNNLPGQQSSQQKVSDLKSLTSNLNPRWENFWLSEEIDELVKNFRPDKSDKHNALYILKRILQLFKEGLEKCKLNVFGYIKGFDDYIATYQDPDFGNINFAYTHAYYNLKLIETAIEKYKEILKKSKFPTESVAESKFKEHYLDKAKNAVIKAEKMYKTVFVPVCAGFQLYNKFLEDFENAKVSFLAETSSFDEKNSDSNKGPKKHREREN